MPMGRGDARNFSGGGQFGMPPPDVNRNLVGMDDLKRLGSKGSASRQGSTGAPTLLGPPSMFGSRGSNTRKPFPPSSLARGEDSSASSRTNTPPTLKKEKEEKETKHANAFR